MQLLQLAWGLALLVVGAEVLVRGASRLALRLRVPSLIVGLTIVAFGTSAPELAISTMASLDGNADVALGNVVGSNIFNVLFILGASALVTPLLISAQLVRLDVPVMIGVSLLGLLLAADGVIGRPEAAVLLAGLAAYTVFQIRQGMRAASADAAQAQVGGNTILDVLLLLIGLAVLVLGSRAFLDGATGIARSLGVSELVIGLTIVAAGTSLPELATSVVAAFRGERDIAVGNIVGSNVFNLLGVLGFAGVVSTSGIAVASSTLYFDIPVMIAVAFACLPAFFVNSTIARWQGGVFVAYYLAYVAYLVLDQQDHDAIDVLSASVVYFAFPITALTFGVIAVRNWRRRGRPS